MQFPYDIKLIKGFEVAIAFIPNNADGHMHVSNFDFSTEQYKWQTQVKCPGTTVWYANSTLLAIDNDKGVIYLGVQSINTNNFLVAIDQNTGLGVGSKYYTASTSNKVQSLEVYGDKVFFMHRTTQFNRNQLDVYDTKTMKIKESAIVNGLDMTNSLRVIQESPKVRYLHLFGGGSVGWTEFQTHADYLMTHSQIFAVSGALVEASDEDMPIFTSTPGPVNIQDFRITLDEKISLLNSYTITNIEQDSKIYPWLSTDKLNKIDPSQTGTINLKLTWTSENLTVVHQLGQYNGQPPPDWVQLDQATGVLRFNAPSATQVRFGLFNRLE